MIFSMAFDVACGLHQERIHRLSINRTYPSAVRCSTVFPMHRGSAAAWILSLLVSLTAERALDNAELTEGFSSNTASGNYSFDWKLFSLETRQETKAVYAGYIYLLAMRFVT